MTETVILNFEIDQGQAITQLKETEKTIISLKEEQKELNKAYKEGEISQEDYIEENIKLQQSLKKEGEQKKTLLRSLETESNSRNAMRQKISNLTKEYNNLNLKTEEGRKRSDALQKELKESIANRELKSKRINELTEENKRLLNRCAELQQQCDDVYRCIPQHNENCLKVNYKPKKMKLTFHKDELKKYSLKEMIEFMGFENVDVLEVEHNFFSVDIDVTFTFSGYKSKQIDFKKLLEKYLKNLFKDTREPFESELGRHSKAKFTKEELEYLRELDKKL